MRNRRLQNVFGFCNMHRGYGNEEVLSFLKIQVPKMQLLTYTEHGQCGKFGVCIANGKEFCYLFNDNLSCFHKRCHIYVKLHCFTVQSGLCGRNLGNFCSVPQKIL